jgi:hypothetical protein
LLEGVELGEPEEIRVEEVEPEEESEGEPQGAELLGISMHALAGAPAPRTMRLMGRILGQQVVILIDTGSTHSFVDQNLAKRLQLPAQGRSQLTVMVANGDIIPCPGCCTTITFSLQEYDFKTNLHLLVLGGCDMVLGVDWLSSLGPILWDFVELTMKFSHQSREISLQGLIKTANNLVKGEGLLRKAGAECKGIWLQLIGAKTPKPKRLQHPALAELLEGFTGVFQEPTELPPSRNFDHNIQLTEGAQPTCARPYRYPYYQKEEIEKLVREMLSTGIIRPSQSPYSSPVLLVRKADGSWRMCVDYHALNKNTIKDKYPIPSIDELLDELHGSVIFSKLDLRSGYHQIRMKSEDIPKTGCRTHEGHYEFLVMPFGLTNAPSNFQSLMNDVFRPYLRKCVLVFFDDILIYSKNIKDHLNHLKAVLELLQNHQLYAKLSKCQFGCQEVEYLGHLISEEGVKADPSKIEAMLNWAIPRTIKALRGFLGLTGYYRKFVKGYGGIAVPLTRLLRKDSFRWDDRAEEAFNLLKTTMSTPPVLGLPDFTKPFIIECDASGDGIGAVLMQTGQPLAYLSQGLKGKSLNLSTYEKELLALVMAIRKWRHYLLGHSFKVRTDQQALKYLLEQRIGTPAQQKWVSKLLGFDFTVEYKKGRENRAADALPRMEWPNTDSKAQQGSEVLITDEQPTCKATYNMSNQAISTLQPSWTRELTNSYSADQQLQQLIQQFQQGELDQTKY